MQMKTSPPPDKQGLSDTADPVLGEPSQAAAPDSSPACAIKACVLTAAGNEGTNSSL